MMTSKMIWAIIVLGYFWVVLGNFDKWFWHLLNLWERPQQGTGVDVRK